MKLFLLLLSFFCFTIPIRSQTIITAAGTPAGIRGGDGGPFSKATFYAPEHFTYDKSGNLYISSPYDNTIRKVDAASGIITTFLNVNLVKAIAFNKQENYMYISASDCIYQFNMATKQMVLFAGKPGSICLFANCGEGVPALTALLDLASGIALDSVGNVYVADQDDNRIRRIDIVTRIITTYAGGGGCNCAGLGDGGPANQAQLLFPWDICFDSRGDLIISDAGVHNIRKVDSKTGIITTIAGSTIGGGWGYSGDGGPAMNARLHNPFGISIDKNDNLYIADQGNQVVRKIDKTGIITTIAGNGTPGYSGDCGPSKKAQLASPRHVIVDPNGGILIADNGNHVIRKIINSIPNVITASTSSLCVNNTLQLIDSAQGGVWQSSNTTIAKVNANGVVTALSQGKVDISYHINNGCNSNSSSINLTVDSIPPMSQIKGGPSVCEGSTISLTNSVTAGVWSSSDSTIASPNANGLIKALSAGTATIKYTASNGQCSNVDSITVVVNPLPKLQAIRGDTSVCINSTATLTNSLSGGTWSINNAQTARINPSSGLVNGISAGNTIVSYTVTNGCGSAVIQSGFVVNPVPNFSLGKDTSICINSKLLLETGISNVSFAWEDGTITRNHLVSLPNLYWLKVTDSNGCSFSDTIDVHNKALPLVQLGNDTIVCNDAKLLLTANDSSIAAYQWQDGSTQPIYPVTKKGQYSVFVRGLNGCTNSDTINVSYLNSPVFTLGNGGTMCPGSTVVLDPLLNNVSYLWQDGSSKPTYSVIQTGVYSLTASNYCGSSKAFVEFKRGFCRLLMPTAFTPNNDGVNDIFQIKYPDFIKTLKLKIFNRWGEMVFETTSAGQGWNGKYKGIDQDAGNYIWTITLTDLQGSLENEMGSVVLVR